ncbi:hypothetical protein PsorP6_011704 [Peronosclerospora sorghi]|uniref:Uncharacterized protein n=1 Tax=Peronosclerospora sorghi TaxID=230839 RepID=A0ACC0WK47_9STRA|nr:hypothetical protein PsorP6_011704 [Peronosclerospora sorghi]
MNFFMSFSLLYLLLLLLNRFSKLFSKLQILLSFFNSQIQFFSLPAVDMSLLGLYHFSKLRESLDYHWHKRTILWMLLLLL